MGKEELLVEKVADIARTVHANPGINLKSLIEKVDHHYASASSARASLRYWAEAGKIKGIRMGKDWKLARFYPLKGVVNV